MKNYSRNWYTTILSELMMLRLNSHIQNLARDAFGDSNRLWIGAIRYTNGDIDQFKWTNNDGFQ